MNPLKSLFKLSPVEYRVLLGGITNSLVYYSERILQASMPTYPLPLKQQLDPHLPSNGEIVGLVAPPLATLVAERAIKRTETREVVTDIRFGTMLYAFPKLIQRIGVNTAYAEGAKLLPAVGTPATASKYGLSSVPTNTGATTRAITPIRGQSKYVVTA